MGSERWSDPIRAWLPTGWWSGWRWRGSGSCSGSRRSGSTARPAPERLDDRSLPGVTWGPVVEWSFVPDGTQWLGGVSTLAADLDRKRPGWRDQVRRAFDAWSMALGITFAEVRDSGKPLGAESPTLRIGGNADPSNVLARAYLPGPGAGSDLTFNTAHDWQAFDVFSVALHELGHAVADLRDGESPVMAPAYQGTLAGLSLADVRAAQSSVTVNRGPMAILSKMGERW